MNVQMSIRAPVFYTASAIILLMVTGAAIFPDQANQSFQTLQGQIVNTAGWFYVLAVAIILIGIFYFALGRYGDIKLGPDHASPDYSYLTWFSMLFSAGIGIGLLFFGVAEPVMHYLNPPKGDPSTISAAREALNLTFFHWGLHAWAIYAVVGLALAYFGYRHNLPLTLRSALYPLIGDKIEGPIGHAVDIFAIIGTVLGVATSLGYGVAQINAGLNYLSLLPESITVQVGLIVVITILATLSVLSGLDRGIRRLSEINMLLAFGLLALVLLTGPTIFLIQKVIQNTGTYLSDLVTKTFNLYAYDPTDWLGGWTIFYWGWWISWSPFVGMFIARISRGRSIREFIFGVLFVPTGFTFLWMTIFGNSAIDIIAGQGPELAAMVQENNAVALFNFLEFFPMTKLLSGITIVMIVIFFVTSADSGALVVNMLASGGKERTPIWQKIYWTGLIGLVAIILLLAGGLAALQTATIASALPFTLVLMAIMYALVRSLNIDYLKKQSMLNTMNTTPVLHTGDQSGGWKQRVAVLASHPTRNQVHSFIEVVVHAALKEVADEMSRRGLEVELLSRPDREKLVVYHNDEIDFTYRVKLWQITSPALNQESESGEISEKLNSDFRAEVYLNEGSQHYCVMGYNKDQIIHDVLDHYEKHRHFLDLLRKKAPM